MSKLGFTLAKSGYTLDLWWNIVFFWDLHMFYLLRPILFRNCRYFTGLCSSNIPRYFLDFASRKYFWWNLSPDLLCWSCLQTKEGQRCKMCVFLVARLFNVGSGKVVPENHASLATVVTPTDRPYLVRNRCLIQHFVFSLFFILIFRWFTGFCHRTWPDLFLFLFAKQN